MINTINGNECDVENPNRDYDIIVMETEPAARKESVKVTQDDLSIS
jgi:hypothetical protein